MKTTHKIIFSDSGRLENIESNSIDLMITSPPYPMIEMWDEIFSKQDQRIAQALKEENGKMAFELMHGILDRVWSEVYRVLKEGGIACINIGDATRKIGEDFQLYSNHSRIIKHCLEIGFITLPEILWRKQTNAPNKFMGSGMLPAGAYVTLEHEYILILRKGKKRAFKTDEDKLSRMKSSFFWEERNVWFSDVWDFKGTRQIINGENGRNRSGAYPFELAYRLINMFSLKGDTVLDPFLGTGTTIIAAMASGRNSVGFEIDENLKTMVFSRTKDIVKLGNEYIDERIMKHLEFVKERKEKKGEMKYKNEHHVFPVMTRQEVSIMINKLEDCKVAQDNVFEIQYCDKPVSFKNDLSSWL